MEHLSFSLFLKVFPNILASPADFAQYLKSHVVEAEGCESRWCSKEGVITRTIDMYDIFTATTQRIMQLLYPRRTGSFYQRNKENNLVHIQISYTIGINVCCHPRTTNNNQQCVNIYTSVQLSPVPP
jgi:hypothetical protein